MFCKGYLFFALAIAITSSSEAVKVNMQGSLSLGRDVMDTISHYLGKGYHQISGRRFMRTNTDPITIEIYKASLCKKLVFCRLEHQQFLESYLISLMHAVEEVFASIMKEDEKIVCLQILKSLLRDVRKVLKSANIKANNKKEGYTWVGVIKKMSSIVLSKAVTFLVDTMTSETKESTTMKKTSIQQLVIAITQTENHYQQLLCTENGFCLQSTECSKSLNSVLTRLMIASDTQIKVLIKAFYEALPDTNFYSHLSEGTVNEFQFILNDMAFTDRVSAKEILQVIQKAISAKLDKADGDKSSEIGNDIILIYAILSDMDYFYSKGRPDPFHAFLNYLYDWTKNGGGKMTNQVKSVIKDLQTMLQNQSDDLITKLTHEVRTFFEITVDPDN